MANIISWFGSKSEKDNLTKLVKLAVSAEGVASDYTCRAIFTGPLKGFLTKSEVEQLDGLVASYGSGQDAVRRHGFDQKRAAAIEQVKRNAKAVETGQPLGPVVDIDEDFKRHRAAGFAAIEVAGQKAVQLFLLVAPRAIEAIDKLIEKEQAKEKKEAATYGLDAKPSAVTIGLGKVRMLIELDRAKLTATPSAPRDPLTLFRRLGYGEPIPAPVTPPEPKAASTPTPEPARPTLSQAEKLAQKEQAKLEMQRRGEITLAKGTK